MDSGQFTFHWPLFPTLFISVLHCTLQESYRTPNLSSLEEHVQGEIVVLTFYFHNCRHKGTSRVQGSLIDEPDVMHGPSTLLSLWKIHELLLSSLHSNSNQQKRENDKRECTPTFKDMLEIIYTNSTYIPKS